MKYGFLFGAGAEAAYGLPSGGKFALEIFRHDTAKSKEAFKNSRDNVDTHTAYANDWLPEGFSDKNISTFGKTERIHIGVRPHKEKINISKEIINKTRGAEAPYAAQIFTHLSVVSSRQRLYWRLRCEEATLDRRNRPNEDK